MALITLVVICNHHSSPHDWMAWDTVTVAFHLCSSCQRPSAFWNIAIRNQEHECFIASFEFFWAVVPPWQRGKRGLLVSVSKIHFCPFALKRATLGMVHTSVGPQCPVAQDIDPSSCLKGISERNVGQISEQRAEQQLRNWISMVWWIFPHKAT